MLHILLNVKLTYVVLNIACYMLSVVSRGELLEAEAAAAGHRGGQGQNYDQIFTSIYFTTTIAYIL